MKNNGSKNNQAKQFHDNSGFIDRELLGVYRTGDSTGA
jgi:hypothetical protein